MQEGLRATYVAETIIWISEAKCNPKRKKIRINLNENLMINVVLMKVNNNILIENCNKKIHLLIDGSLRSCTFF